MDANETNRELYIELLKKCLIGMIYQDDSLWPVRIGGQERYGYLPKLREFGRDYPSKAHSMIGLKRMNNVQQCVETCLQEGVPGDFIETGVFRGGTVIFMRGILKAYGATDRTVWVADSFEGLPEPDLEKNPADAYWANKAGQLAVSLEKVQQNFATYGLLDGQVQFLKGWFKDTLHTAPVQQLAVLRLDGDLYASTWDALTALYPRLSVGGFIIIDDYVLESCRKAVTDYREQYNIQDPIVNIDGYGVYWRRTG